MHSPRRPPRRSARGRQAATAIAMAAGLAACKSGGSGGSGGASSPPPRAEPNAVSGLDSRPSARGCVLPDPPQPATGIVLEPVFEAFRDLDILPLALRMPPRSSSHWYIVDRYGRLLRFRNQPDARDTELALDIRSRVTIANECGMLDAAFHPNFAANGHVFVFYIAGGDVLTTRIARFTSRDGGKTFDRRSEKSILEIPQAVDYHKGGTLGFGRDGYLYAAFGDDGTPANAQDLASLKGKVVRIDVNRGDPYAVPADNPFAGGGGRPEIFALGFRNPWRWSFDRATGELWLGDVGEVDWEEVNKVVRGANHGWPFREGARCAPGQACTAAGFTDPIFEWPHAEGARAVVGGYRYRGGELPELAGAYVFGDWARKVWVLHDTGGNGEAELLAELGLGAVLFSFCEDNDGELYVVAGGRRIFRLARPRARTRSAEFPASISALGCLDPRDTSDDSPLVRYDINSPLWSDGADKERAFMIPDGSRIRVLDDGDWEFPTGSVFLKTFTIGNRPIETRLLARHADGSWGGYSYEWNDAGSDAQLLAERKTRRIKNIDWTFPSRSDCFQCHTDAAGVVLGLETAQLNRTFTYVQTGRTRNQLTTLEAIGLFEPRNLGRPQDLPALHDVHDFSATLAERARAYLHTNCSNCHRPGGSARGDIDFRHHVSVRSMRICGVKSVESNGALLLDAGSPESSAIVHRMRTLGSRRMPPLASTVVDRNGIELIEAWIRSIDDCP